MEVCEKCRGNLRVKDVRHGDGEIYRKRICDSCGAVTYTVEYQVEETKTFLDTWKSLNTERFYKSMLRKREQRNGAKG